MKIFQIKNDKLYELTIENEGKSLFNYEKTLHELIEKNLDSLFTGLEFVKSEYAIDGFRMDTVAYDAEKKSFVIIEYKNVESKSVIDQGFTYYDILENNHAEFVLLYNETKKRTLSKNDINWDETRLIFISPIFNKYQIRAGNFRGLPIELYEIRKYAQDIITLDKLENNEKIKSDNKQPKKKKQTITMYDEYEYLKGKYGTPIPTIKITNLYFMLKNLILNHCDKSMVKQKKKYVGFYSVIDNSSICSLIVAKNQIKVNYAPKTKEIFDKDSFVQDISNVGHWGLGDFLSIIKNNDDVLKALEKIMLVYKDKTGFQPKGFA